MMSKLKIYTLKSKSKHAHTHTSMNAMYVCAILIHDNSL